MPNVATYLEWQARIFFSALCILMLLSACVPTAGPDGDSFSEDASEYLSGSQLPGGERDLPFVLIDINKPTVDILTKKAKTSYFKGELTDRRSAADIRIGLGDVIRVTIFEAGSGGLFVPTGGTLNSGNFVSIPDQEVDRTGSISVPYAARDGDGGVIRVYNRRPIEVQAEIEARLADRAIEPQVVVTVANRSSDLFSVIGDVNAPGRFKVPQGGIRILDAIGMAGGPKSSEYDTLITLQRSSSTGTARMSTLIEQPENNVYVRPKDVISLKKEERYVNVFGATGEQDRLPFNAEKLTLADALARTKGLDSERADPRSVVLFRWEDQETIRKLGSSLKGFADRDTIPTVYRVNMDRPEGFFLAQHLPLESDDMIYVSSHPFTDVTKVLAVLRDILLIRLIDD